MDPIFQKYLDPDFVQWLFSFFKLIPAGMMLAFIVFAVGWAVVFFLSILKRF